ncbi:hypothetical protein TNCV_519341 [Trichonephila clavipes]|nr:hypothetical protein TNCV_519341 [Trichonephila clavipes]
MIITFVDSIISVKQLAVFVKGRPRLREERVAGVRLLRIPKSSNASDHCLESFTQKLRTTSLSSAVATSFRTDRPRFTCQIRKRDIDACQ